MGSYEVRDVLLSLTGSLEGWPLEGSALELAGPPQREPKPAPGCSPPGGSVTRPSGPGDDPRVPIDKCRPGGSVTRQPDPEPDEPDEPDEPKDPEPKRSYLRGGAADDVLTALLSDLRDAGRADAPCVGPYEVRDVLLSVSAALEGWSIELAGPPQEDPQPPPPTKCTPGGSVTNSGGPPTRCKPGGSITHSGGPPKREYGPELDDRGRAPKAPPRGATFEADVLAGLLSDLRAASPGGAAQA